MVVFHAEIGTFSVLVALALHLEVYRNDFFLVLATT